MLARQMPGVTIKKVIRLKDQMGIDHCDKFFSDSHSDQPLADIADEAFLVEKGKIVPWY